MKLGLDIMGGDHAPQNAIEGAILALPEIGKDDVLVLTGDEGIIKEELSKRNVDVNLFSIVHTEQVVEMEEKPVKALKEKPNSSLFIGFRMLREGTLDGFASAGNSGAVLAGAVSIVKCIPGVMRPCIGTVLPTENNDYAMLLDIGTTPDAKPDILVQFAILGSAYMEIFGKRNPSVCLLNVGTEDGKGNQQVQTTFNLMKESSHVNFVGNREPRDFFKGEVDVFVADGFVGNIVLKELETFYYLLKKRGISDPFFDALNYEIYGGTPLLGINAPVVLGHGISSSLAFKNMILQMKNVHDKGIVDKLRNIFYEYNEL
ncbi:MAG: phosphate acyltransferase PlsX [Bacteroidales bacterium]|jgi:glycerol-3-phosphate acyltransferase PlsX|nr:phosphate acyltransferase PlsX [Bacteroidales bacterium]